MTRHNRSVRLVGVVLVSLLATPVVRADPVLWQYSATVGPLGGPLNGLTYSQFMGNVQGSSDQVWENHTAYAWPAAWDKMNSLGTANLDASAKAMVGSNRIVFGDVAYGSTPPSPYTPYGSLGYGYALTITDLASGKSGTAYGNVLVRTDPSDMYTYHPKNILPPATQLLHLGNNYYQVTFNFPWATDPPATRNLALADVQVNPVPPPSPAPEPGALVLAALGLGGASLAAWRQKRQRSWRAASPGTQPAAA